VKKKAGKKKQVRSYKDPWYVPHNYLRTSRAEAAALEAVSWLDTRDKGAGPRNYIEWFKVLHTCAYHAIKSTSEQGKAIWTNRWGRVLAYLVEANMGLVHSRVRYYSRHCTDTDELESEAASALYRAVCRFNPWIGWTFSTFACNVINNSIGRYLQLRNKNKKLTPVSFEKEYERPIVGKKRSDELVLDRLCVAMEKNLAELNDAEKQVLSLRFPLDGSNPVIFELIGARMGLCKERVRQIQVKALRKLREVLEEDPVLQ